MFWTEIWKISVFLSEKNFSFLEVKFSMYLNRCVVVMFVFFVFSYCVWWIMSGIDFTSLGKTELFIFLFFGLWHVYMLSLMVYLLFLLVSLVRYASSWTSSTLFFSTMQINAKMKRHPASILYKSTAGRYWPDGLMTARCRFIEDAYWDAYSRSRWNRRLKMNCMCSESGIQITATDLLWKLAFMATLVEWLRFFRRSNVYCGKYLYGWPRFLTLWKSRQMLQTQHLVAAVG